MTNTAGTDTNTPVDPVVDTATSDANAATEATVGDPGTGNGNGDPGNGNGNGNGGGNAEPDPPASPPGT